MLDSKIKFVAQTARYARSYFGWSVFAVFWLPMCLGALLGMRATMGSQSQQELRAGQEFAWVDGDFDSAEKSFKKVVLDYPGGPYASQAYFEWAQVKEIRGEQGESVAVLYASSARLSTDPQWAAEASMKAAKHWEQASAYDQAASYYSKAKEHPSQQDHALHALASLALAQGHVDVAMERFQILTESRNSKWSNMGQMGVSVSYARLGELNAALAEVDQDSDRRERLFERISALRR